MLHDILDDDHIQWHPPLIGNYTNFWPLLIWTLLPNLTFYLIVQGFHRTYATGAACQQRTLTPPDTWSCHTLGLACVLMSRPISPEPVLSPDFWISNIPRYFSFAFEIPAYFRACLLCYIKHRESTKRKLFNDKSSPRDKAKIRGNATDRISCEPRITQTFRREVRCPWIMRVSYIARGVFNKYAEKCHSCFGKLGTDKICLQYVVFFLLTIWSLVIIASMHTIWKKFIQWFINYFCYSNVIYITRSRCSFTFISIPTKHDVLIVCKWCYCHKAW